MKLARTTAIAVGVGIAALTGCAPGDVDTDSSESTALVETFFAHLEAGRASDAAALTTIAFDRALVDDDFYRASHALPTDAHVVTSTGSQSGASVTVEFAFEGVDAAVTLDVGTTRDGDDLKIARLDTTDWIGVGTPAPGTLTVNDRQAYEIAERTEVTLLPAAYAVEYTDPTGILDGLGRGSAFTAYVPEVRNSGGETLAAGFHFTPTYLPDVEPRLEDALARLQAACEADGFTGASCPTEFPAEPREASDTEWFRQPGPEIRYLDGEFQATVPYKVVFWDGDVSTTLDASYSGTISRDDSGTIVFTASS